MTDPIETARLLVGTARALGTNPYSHGLTLDQIDAAAAAAGIDSSDPFSSEHSKDDGDESITSKQRLVLIRHNNLTLEETDMSGAKVPLFYGKPHQLDDV